MLAQQLVDIEPGANVARGKDGADLDEGAPVAREDMLQVVAGCGEDHAAGHRIAGDAAPEPANAAGQLLLRTFAEEVDFGDNSAGSTPILPLVANIGEQPVVARADLYLAADLPCQGNRAVFIRGAVAKAFGIERDGRAGTHDIEDHADRLRSIGRSVRCIGLVAMRPRLCRRGSEILPCNIGHARACRPLATLLSVTQALGLFGTGLRWRQYREIVAIEAQLAAVEQAPGSPSHEQREEDRDQPVEERLPVRENLHEALETDLAHLDIRHRRGQHTAIANGEGFGGVVAGLHVGWKPNPRLIQHAFANGHAILDRPIEPLPLTQIDKPCTEPRLLLEIDRSRGAKLDEVGAEFENRGGARVDDFVDRPAGSDREEAGSRTERRAVRIHPDTADLPLLAQTDRARWPFENHDDVELAAALLRVDHRPEQQPPKHLNPDGERARQVSPVGDRSAEYLRLDQFGS